MPVVHAEDQQASAGGEGRASVASAWIAGSSPAMTNGTNGKERKFRRREQERVRMRRRVFIAIFGSALLGGTALLWRNLSSFWRPRFDVHSVTKLRHCENTLVNSQFGCSWKPVARKHQLGDRLDGLCGMLSMRFRRDTTSFQLQRRSKI
jgi:hypothetical protein